MSEATHCQDDKISLREPVVNLLLILPTHINKYFKSSLFCISYFQTESFLEILSQVDDHAPFSVQWRQ